MVANPLYINLHECRNCCSLCSDMQLEKQPDYLPLLREKSYAPIGVFRFLHGGVDEPWIRYGILRLVAAQCEVTVFN